MGVSHGPSEQRLYYWIGDAMEKTCIVNLKCKLYKLHARLSSCLLSQLWVFRNLFSIGCQLPPL